MCPVDRPAIEHGAVTIDGEHFAAVGAQPVDGDVIDLDSVALLPGLVNAHTHLEFSHLSKPLGRPGMPLLDWIRLVIAERGGRMAEPSRAIAQGVAECLRHGTTTLGEIAGEGADAYSTVGPVDATLFAEVIGFSRARAASAYEATTTRLDELRGASPTARVGISPHAPYTVSPDLLRRLIVLASERQLPVAMHLAESAEELQLLRDGTGPFQELLDERSMWDATAIPRRSRPLDYLRTLAEAPRALVIHGNFLDPEEHVFLAAQRERMSLVYCPRTHTYFGHSSYPLAELLSAGVRVALGTDSRASNPDLSLLAEMRHVARAHPEIDPNEVLRMGTLAGAEALGSADEAGSITPGKLANLVAIPLAEDAGRLSSELLAALLADDRGPSAAWLRGNVVV